MSESQITGSPQPDVGGASLPAEKKPVSAEQIPDTLAPDSRPPSLAKPFSDKERADTLLKLAKSAYDQFDRLAAIGWKLRLAIWVAFGTTAGFVLSSDKWQPSYAVAIMGTGLILVVVVVVVFVWAPSQYKRDARWMRVAQYWESVVENVLQVDLPEELHPAAGGHIRYPQTKSTTKTEPWRTHPVYLAQAAITGLLALLAIIALFSKAASATDSGHLKIAIEGGEAERISVDRVRK